MSTCAIKVFWKKWRRLNYVKCLSNRRAHQTGKKCSVVFIMPKTPVHESNTAFIEKINQAAYDYYRGKAHCLLEGKS
jgi:hypothetical protein